MPIRLPSIPQLSRNAKLLIVTSGIFAISFYGIHALLSVLYILRLGHGPKYVGWFGAAAAFSYMAMSLPGGALGRRFGARTVMLIGGVLTVCGIAALPLVEFVPHPLRTLWPIASQLIRTAGWSMLNVNLVPALMASTTTQNRNNAYAFASVFRGLGTFLGTVIGGALPGLFAAILNQRLDAPGPYRWAIWFGAGIGLIAITPITFIRRIQRADSTQRTEDRTPFPVLLVALMIAHVYFVHGGWATCQAFCNAYLDRALELPASSIGLIAGIGQLVAIFAPMLAPRLATRYGNSWILMVAAIGTAVSLLPLALIPHWAAAGIGRLGMAVLFAVWMPALQVFQMEEVSTLWRSLAYGAVSTAMALAYGSVSIAGGYIVSARGYGTLFLIGAVTSTLGTAVMWHIRRSKIVRRV